MLCWRDNGLIVDTSLPIPPGETFFPRFLMGEGPAKARPHLSLPRSTGFAASHIYQSVLI